MFELISRNAGCGQDSPSEHRAIRFSPPTAAQQAEKSMGQQELYSNKFFENDEDPFGEQAARRKKAADRVRRCLTALLAIAIIGGGTLWFMQNKGELLLGKGAARQMGPSDTAAAAPQ